jgi:cytochrome d ubiquinol oxidase subunit I
MISFVHMEVACIETTLFFITGLCAWALLREARSGAKQVSGGLSGAAAGGSFGEALQRDGAKPEDFSSRKNPYSEKLPPAGARSEFFLQAFKFALALAVVFTPLQIGLGDLSGQTIAQYQPEKLAAVELHWNTNPAGQGASWSLVAWPAPGGGSNSFDVPIPDALSILTTHSTTGTVPGLNAFPESDRPSLVDDTLVFYSFRIMVGIGFALFFLMLLGAWYWWRGTLTVETISTHRMFWRLWIWAVPLGFIATEAGWMVREIGRQPWVVYHLMRVGEGLSSNLTTSAVATTTAIFTLLYLAFGILFIYFTLVIMKKGPDFDSLPPQS